ncbi:MAG: hypothetical protein C7B47_03890 [Sulfobacillus thermosulfidooxidans]|uniref:Cytosine permease n=1 Tax=Sulfobacillus thermosulfidooxidans TaxID=28034 RepID=A0A2T2X2R9_SULTH|nr:MAG: hypothetical protein C7B47_03890 [Sulfobacillus thermosulfidooxidans]
MMASEELVEPLGIEWVPSAKRHGKPSQLFSLWFSANLGMPAWLVGVLGPVLGLDLSQTLFAIILGNIIASLLVGLTAKAGTGQGLAQLPLSRSIFGRRGNYLPSFLNTLSAIGWYTINTAVGGEAMAKLIHIPLALGLFFVAAGQIALGYLGYDIIHRFERVMVYVQGVLFILMSYEVVHHLPHLAHAQAGNYGDFLLELAAVVSYSFSWAPYASDYGRYLPESTSPQRVFWATFWGTFLGTVWVECIGAVVGALGWGNLSPIGMVQNLMGPLTGFALLAIIFGTMTADAINGYTATLSLLTLDIPIRRTQAAIFLGAVGWLVAWLANSHLLSDYENFLLLLSYWVAPWVGIVLVAAHQGLINKDRALLAKGVDTAAIGGFLVGIVAVIPFMSTILFEGPVAKMLDNGDTGYYAGMLVGALVYYLLLRLRKSAALSHSLS